MENEELEDVQTSKTQDEINEKVDEKDGEISENEEVNSENEEIIEPENIEVDEQLIMNLKAEIAGQEARITDLEAMVAENKNDAEKHEKLTKEFANFKDRTAKDKADAKLNGQIKIITECLDAIDNLDRAVNLKSETQEFKTGLEMVNNSLKSKLEALGYQPTGD